jgi:hypothetical protein
VLQDHLRWPCALTPFPRILAKFITPLLSQLTTKLIHGGVPRISCPNGSTTLYFNMFIVHGMPSKLNLHGTIVTVGCCDQHCMYE